MVSTLEGLDVEDELNLFLVEKGLKPSALVTLTPTYINGYDIFMKDYTMYVNEQEDVFLKEEDIRKFEESLKSLGVSYNLHSRTRLPVPNTKDKIIFVEELLFQIGKDKASLDRLIGAKNNFEIGLALGYPEEAVRAFDKVIDGERRDGTYLLVQLAKAKQAKIEIPSWLAYISWVPEQLDIVNRNISRTSEKLGKEYQSFVRENNVELARRVEEHFRNKPLPDRWEKESDGSYILFFP